MTRSTSAAAPPGLAGSSHRREHLHAFRQNGRHRRHSGHPHSKPIQIDDPKRLDPINTQIRTHTGNRRAMLAQHTGNVDGRHIDCVPPELRHPVSHPGVSGRDIGTNGAIDALRVVEKRPCIQQESRCSGPPDADRVTADPGDPPGRPVLASTGLQVAPCFSAEENDKASTIWFSKTLGQRTTGDHLAPQTAIFSAKDGGSRGRNRRWAHTCSEQKEQRRRFLERDAPPNRVTRTIGSAMPPGGSRTHAQRRGHPGDPEGNGLPRREAGPLLAAIMEMRWEPPDRAALRSTPRRGGDVRTPPRAHRGTGRDQPLRGPPSDREAGSSPR